MHSGIWKSIKWSGLALAASLPLSAIADDKKPEAIYSQMEIFAEVLALVQDEYVEEVDTESLIENALNGALSKLDPHSAYVPPVNYTQQREAVRREYGGLGICLLYTSPSPRDQRGSRMPSSA